MAIEYSSPDKGLTVDLSDGEGYISYRGSSWERVETEQNCNVFESVYEERGFLELIAGTDVKVWRKLFFEER